MSIRRQNRWMLNNISARMLFYAGIFILPAFLLQQNLLVRASQVGLFVILALAAGKRLYWLYFITVILTVVFFHLLVPTGEVLAQPFGFAITRGAIRTGAFKALAILGMVFLSLASVRADLRLPGRIGSIVGKTFWCFEQIMERRPSLTRRSAIASIDQFLLSLYQDVTVLDEGLADTRARKGTAGRSSTTGRIVVFSIVLLQWAALFISLV